jgi:hypothetical protein
LAALCQGLQLSMIPILLITEVTILRIQDQSPLPSHVYLCYCVCAERGKDGKTPKAYLVWAGVEPLEFQNFFPYWEPDPTVCSLAEQVCKPSIWLCLNRLRRFFIC